MFGFRLLLLTGLSAAVILPRAEAQSFYPVRLEDKTAVYLSNDRFGTKGDGTVSHVQKNEREVLIVRVRGAGVDRRRCGLLAGRESSVSSGQDRDRHKQPGRPPEY